MFDVQVFVFQCSMFRCFSSFFRFGSSFAWISEREAVENNRLRKFIDSGKEFGKDPFEKDKTLQTVKNAIADITGFAGLFKRTGDDIIYKTPDESRGMTIDRLLELVMEDVSRPAESIREKLEILFERISRKEFEKALGIVKFLKKRSRRIRISYRRRCFPMGKGSTREVYPQGRDWTRNISSMEKKLDGKKEWPFGFYTVLLYLAETYDILI